MTTDQARSGRRPNLFVVGAGRSGTSSLWHYLGQHPEIFMTEMKETFFFSAGGTDFQPVITDEADYLRLFERAGDERWLGEATPTYFRNPQAPERIHAASPDARILVVLRDPVERAWSAYWHARRYGVETRSFEQVIDESDRSTVPGARRYVNGGLYAEGLERYRSLFGDHVLVLVFEEFFADVRGGMRRVFEWLEVDPGRADTLRPDVLNAYSRPRNNLAARFYSGRALRYLAKRALPVAMHRRLERVALVRDEKPELDPELRRRLAGFFVDDARELERLLGRPLPWNLEG